MWDVRKLALAIDSSTVTQEEVIEAARLSNAHGFIMALPKGYDTKVCSTNAAVVISCPSSKAAT